MRRIVDVFSEEQYVGTLEALRNRSIDNGFLANRLMAKQALLIAGSTGLVKRRTGSDRTHECIEPRWRGPGGQVDEVLGFRPAQSTTHRMLLRSMHLRIGWGLFPEGWTFGHRGQFDTFSRGRIRELTGRVPAKTTYQEWLTGQSAEFQRYTGRSHAEGCSGRAG